MPRLLVEDLALALVLDPRAYKSNLFNGVQLRISDINGVTAYIVPRTRHPSGSNLVHY